MKKKYCFYGWQSATMNRNNPDFPGITTPQQLYDILSTIWCRRTCAPRMQQDWSENNRTLGQCSITAFLVQDIYGGKVYGIPLPDGSIHCYNEVDGQKFDLTSEQFAPESISYGDDPEQFREVHFQKHEKYERYLYLKQQLNKYLNKK